ncbi:hypothetical protein DCAR_0625253 [Daucus carota subsp. sativus]|uniref:RRP15-like protein n=1 Tax=Daucus carota subsp. sativus TaxID=79200 RepID=A0A161ZUD3_DAUCS|nr:PREDICTED: RRP15-like protein [Daucus carota subsp. sativus]WOH05832.1 hypothetical protein DCAR_0625253 [Daucus carota subsp. sativus]
MAEETQIQESGNVPMKRRLGQKKGGKGKKKMKVYKGSGEKVKVNKKMQKIFRKRARDYNSDDDEEGEDDDDEGDELVPVIRNKKNQRRESEEVDDEKSSDDDDGEDREDKGEEFEVSEDEDGEIQPGITKFTKGSSAFRKAFMKITKKKVADSVLGPVLSAHKKLIAEKLAEEEVERKVKGEVKKEKHIVGEKGHVQLPANFLDTHEKFLIGIATKGVVKLFNAVNKAQSAKKGLNPERAKDAKVIKQKKRAAFFSELGKKPYKSEASSKAEGEGPSWAPLRDNFMLTNSKLKDWDKMHDTTGPEDSGMPTYSSSDDED